MAHHAVICSRCGGWFGVTNISCICSIQEACDHMWRLFPDREVFKCNRCGVERPVPGPSATPLDAAPRGGNE